MSDLGIIIVNYNVRDLLRDCLASIYDSQAGLDFQVCVVDNGSGDDSAAMVEAEYPEAHVIRAENRGYAVGNNLGLRWFGFGPGGGEGGGPPRYALLLNADTLLPPKALADMVAFMDAHPQAGVAGPQLVRADGSLDRACRRSFPTPEVALYRISGLSRLFPQSERFGQYNLTYLAPDVTTQLDSVVGAFMLIRRETLAQVGLLDEQYFMYAEDLDFCYRAKKVGWEVWYNAAVTVLHYKGQSSRQRSSFANRHFYKTMRIFHDKHFKEDTLFLVNWTIYAAIGALAAWAQFRDQLRPAEQRGVASARPLEEGGIRQ
jgi:N-acetylglucosaminyl-diphospho-decaprenol L-rhamnosyltransferase